MIPGIVDMVRAIDTERCETDYRAQPAESGCYGGIEIVRPDGSKVVSLLSREAKLLAYEILAIHEERELAELLDRIRRR